MTDKSNTCVGEELVTPPTKYKHFLLSKLHLTSLFFVVYAFLVKASGANTLVNGLLEYPRNSAFPKCFGFFMSD